MEKTCKACGKTKSITSFYKDKREADGFKKRCKICVNIQMKSYRKVEEKERGEKVQLKGVGKGEWCKMYKALSKIGYNPTRDIHTQFIERHPELKQKKRPVRNVISYTYEDCLDILNETDTSSDEELS